MAFSGESEFENRQNGF